MNGLSDAFFFGEQRKNTRALQIRRRLDIEEVQDGRHDVDRGDEALFPRSRKPATRPITITDGGLIPAACARSGRSPTVAVTTSCCGRVPQRTTAAGVSGASPSATSDPQIFGRFLTPM